MNLRNEYFDPKKPGSFSGVTSFIKELKRRKKISNKTDFETFFLKNETSSIHKPIRNKFLRNKTIVPHIDHTWQADLIDLSTIEKFNDGYKWLLTVIDVFSKVAYVIPIKNKTATSVVEGFKNILSQTKQPKYMQTDKV